MLARNLHFSHTAFASHDTPYSLPPISPVITHGAPPVTDAGISMMEINRHALMIAYIDDFHLMMIVTLLAIPLILLLRKGRRPDGGAPVLAD